MLLETYSMSKIKTWLSIWLIVSGWWTMKNILGCFYSSFEWKATTRLFFYQTAQPEPTMDSFWTPGFSLILAEEKNLFILNMDLCKRCVYAIICALRFTSHIYMCVFVLTHIQPCKNTVCLSSPKLISNHRFQTNHQM